MVRKRTKGSTAAKPRKHAKSPGDEPYETNEPDIVVGIGASAGGLMALRQLLSNPGETDRVAFVIVQHLAPKQETHLVELLQAQTDMDVAQAAPDVGVEAGKVYVIPPDALLRIEGRRLRVQAPVAAAARANPIDAFLRSLGEDMGEAAVGVVMSGTGTDGTSGLRAVKEHGGLTIAQARPAQGEATGFHSGMPDSAIASGLVDFVLPAEEIGQQVARYAGHLKEVRETKGPQRLSEEVADHLGEVCALLLMHLGHDFRDYKTSTLVRRMQRRMQVRHVLSAKSYIRLLRDEPDELHKLFCDFLIGVTHFFRDRDAFAALEKKVIPEVVAAADNAGIRVWVPGCSTGEEAYSIAILLYEALERSQRRLRVQVFASDIDEEAVQHAREARYSGAIREEVSPERLARFFVRENDRYRVRDEVRAMCVFARHDVLRDPPFSHMGLISCRNVMIYMRPELQRRLLRILHYALRSGGHLFLGPSETVGQDRKLFDTQHKKHRIFRRRDDVATDLSVLPSAAGALGRAVHNEGVFASRAVQTEPLVAAVEAAHELVMDRYAPAYVVVDEKNDILHYSGHTGPFLEAPSGAPTLNIVDLARRGLRMKLRTALQRAKKSGTGQIHEDLRAHTNGGTCALDLIVEPVPRAAGRPDEAPRFAVIFRERPAVAPAPAPGQNGAPQPELERDAVIEQLEAELESARESLQTMVEESESSNEELQTSNEELLSMNEELQSTNEELETSTEELQSVNEELETVNQELTAKLEALNRANSDLKNLLESTQIATLFLDRSLHIRWFNPAISGVFSIRDTDTGRPVTDLAPRFGDPGLVDDARRVLEDLKLREREVHGRDDDTSFLLRILPYRTVNDVIDGVVLVFVDITERRHAEMEAHRSRSDLMTLVDSISDAFIGLDNNLCVTHFNRRAEALFGRGRKEVFGRRLERTLPNFKGSDFARTLEQVAAGESHEFETDAVVAGRRLHVQATPSASGVAVLLHETPPRETS